MGLTKALFELFGPSSDLRGLGPPPGSLHREPENESNENTYENVASAAHGETPAHCYERANHYDKIQNDTLPPCGESLVATYNAE